ncbi:MAG: sigma-54-dependent transcriptional regulator [bacterium]
MNDFKILIVEDDRDMADNCFKLFKRNKFDALVAYSAQEALDILSRNGPVSIVLTDLKMPVMDGIELLKRIKQQSPETDVIVMTGYGTIQNAVQAIKIGASDYITKPFNKDELLHVIKKIIESRQLRGEVAQLRTQLKEKYGFDNIIGKSKQMLDIFTQGLHAARSDSSVLIIGESGTGKELIARAIHQNSRRSAAPFVPVNCGALPKELIESELFGHKKGAFTGADKSTPGLFRSAHKGTIFLDEIAEMPKEVQVILLRVLQEMVIRPVGDTREIPIDVRVVSATNRQIEQALEQGQLRQDLFYRISVVVITIPPLRERQTDIPFLVRHFIEKFNRVFHRKIQGIERPAVNILMEYAWPGNVRELENFIEGLYVMGIEKIIRLEDVRAILKREVKPSAQLVVSGDTVSTLSRTERNAVEQALIAAKGNKSKAAALLGISRTRLYKKLELYNIKYPA